MQYDSLKQKLIFECLHAMPIKALGEGSRQASRNGHLFCWGYIRAALVRTYRLEKDRGAESGSPFCAGRCEYLNKIILHSIRQGRHHGCDHLHMSECECKTWLIYSLILLFASSIQKQKSTKDVQNFDSDFTEATPQLSPVEESSLEKIDQQLFHGFSYTNPNLFFC